MAHISDMLGRTYAAVSGEAGGDELRFAEAGGSGFRFIHEQYCCESVAIEDICGDLADLVGRPLILAEEVSNTNMPEPHKGSESYTWTFYRFATVKGTVTVRWLGESNGYYSESVDFEAFSG